MAKRLSDVLKGTNASRVRPGRTGSKPGVDYAPKMPDENKFVAAHDTEEFEDRVGNGPDVYNAANVSQSSDTRHGHTPDPASHNMYRQHNEEAPATSTRPVKRPGAVSSSPRPQPRPTRIGSVRGEESPRDGVYEPTTRGTGVVREENQVGEEKEMMKRQLNFIKYAAGEIIDHVDTVDDPEEWFQNKLSGLHNSIKGLHAYIEGDKRLKNDDMPKMPGMKTEEAEGDERVQPKDTRGKKNLRMITGDVKESKTSKVNFHDIPDEIAPHAEHAIRNDFHSQDAIDYMYGMAKRPENREWVKNNRKGLRKMFKSHGLQTESNNGSPKTTASEQARARFDKKQERREMRQEREDDN